MLVISGGDARFDVRHSTHEIDCVGCNGWSIYLALDISSVIAALCYRSAARVPTPATEYMTEKPTTCSEPEKAGPKALGLGVSMLVRPIPHPRASAAKAGAPLEADRC